MFCTGGMRTKSLLHLLENGFEEVYHLKGGILNLETIPPEEVTGMENALFSITEYRLLMG